MNRWSKRPEQGAAAAVARTIDQSGATQPYAFTITDGQAAFNVTATGQTDHVGKSYTGVTALTVVGSIFNDSFNVDLAPVATGATISLDGEAGTDSLVANFRGISATFKVNADGSVDSDVGAFRNFESYDLSFAGGTSVVRTSTGADKVAINSGDVTLHAGAGDDVITTAAASTFDIDGGEGKDSWTAGLMQKGGAHVTYVDGVFSYAGASTATGFEKVNLAFSGAATFTVSGDVSVVPVNVQNTGQFLDASYDLSAATSAASVGAGSLEGHDYYTTRIGAFVQIADDDVYFGNSLIASINVIGTSFDDHFRFDFTSTDGAVSYDGGAGTDTLDVETYGSFSGERVAPVARFVVHDDGVIESNFQHFANFERFNIVTSYDSYIVTGQLADTITGSGTFFGKGGDDILKADRNNYNGARYPGTILDGGAGDDRLIGDGTSIAAYLDADGDVTVSVGDGAQDTGGAGIDTLSGIVGLIGSAYNDVLTGDDRDNTLDGAGGDDTLIGSGGTDRVSYAYAGAGVTVSLALAGRQNTIGAGRDLLSGFENLTGSAFNDVLAGDSGDNILDGGDGADKASFAAATEGVAVDLRITGAQASLAGVGADTLINIEGIIGSAFDDVINGDFRDNVIEGGAGADRLDGTTGFDVATYAGATAGVSVDLRVTSAQDTGGAGVDTLANFEGLTGSHFTDTLIADGANNRLVGNSGDDRLTGGNGSDELRGGDGVDTAVYQTGNWSTYVVAGSRGTYTVTNIVKGDMDTLYSVEKIQLPSGTYALADLVNAAPNARADKVGGVTEAGGGRPGKDTASGDVLANDRDANLGTPGLGETLTVTGVASGRGPQSFTKVGDTRVIEGTYGTLTIHRDGTFDYLLDNDRAATEALRSGKTGRDVFTYQIADAHGATSTATLAVAVKGTDDPASIQASAFGDDHGLHGVVIDHAAHLALPTDLPLA